MGKPIKVLQINSVNYGSTGNIMLNISQTVQNNGGISYVAYANSRSNKINNVNNGILISNIFERNVHLKMSYYTGLNGCFSTHGTKKFLNEVEKIKPDVIHLHNLHNCYINLMALFKYIKEKKIPIVWTLHDCWAFTGQCSHFSMVGCDKWKTGCYECQQIGNYPESHVDKTKKMYQLKKEWFTGIENLTIVTPSQWLADRVKESFLACYKVVVINNGIDLNIFKPTKSNFRKQYGLHGKIILLGVASGWSKSKGLDIFIELSKILPNSYKIVLVGLSKEQIRIIPKEILGLEKTNNPQELAKIYSAADWFINPSMEETMGLVTAEAIACGTPAIVSNVTAVPEVINSDSGIVVNSCDTQGFYDIIESLEDYTIKKENCLKRATEFDMYKKYNQYMHLYNILLMNNTSF